MYKGISILLSFLSSFLLSTLALAEPEAKAWTDIGKKDLAVIEEAIREHHPGVLDHENAAFREWLKTGHDQATRRLEQAESFEAYQYALTAFIAGFKDRHLFLPFRVQTEVIRWPGFVVGYQNGRFVVEASNDALVDVPVGAELIACDGQEVRQVMKDQVFPFFPEELSSEAGWLRVTPELFLDRGNPYVSLVKEATFRVDGNEVVQVLNWSNVYPHQLNPILRQSIQTVELAEAGLQEFGKDGAWVRIPSFWADDDKQRQELEQLLVQIEEARDLPFIVVDIRGNRGGTRYWADRVLERLLGAAPSKARAYERIYRLSEQNIARSDRRLALLKKQFGKDSREYVESERDHTAMVRALQKGQRLWSKPARQEADIAQKKPISSQKIYLVTDAACQSSGLYFTELLAEQPNVVHVGQAPNSEAPYYEPVPVPLPSGLATLYHPIQMVRKPFKATARIPKFIYRGRMDDTAGIEQWLLTLEKSAR